MLTGKVGHSSSRDRRVPQSRKSSMVWIWQHDKRTDDDNKIILNCVRKLMKNKSEKEARRPKLKKKTFEVKNGA